MSHILSQLGWTNMPTDAINVLTNAWTDDGRPILVSTLDWIFKLYPTWTIGVIQAVCLVNVYFIQEAINVMSFLFFISCFAF